MIIRVYTIDINDIVTTCWFRVLLVLIIRVVRMAVMVMAIEYWYKSNTNCNSGNMSNKYIKKIQQRHYCLVDQTCVTYPYRSLCQHQGMSLFILLHSFCVPHLFLFTQVIIATNAAVSSVTFPDVDTVICMGKLRMFDQQDNSDFAVFFNAFINHVTTVAISIAFV